MKRRPSPGSLERRRELKKGAGKYNIWLVSGLVPALCSWNLEVCKGGCSHRGGRAQQKPTEELKLNLKNFESLLYARHCAIDSDDG